jgi:hypothetical protein
MKMNAFEKNLEGCFAVYDDLLDYLTEHSLHHTSLCGDEIITSDFFDILLSMSVKYNFRVEEAESIYTLLLDMHINPNKAVYWHMLRVYSRTGDVKGAIGIAEHCRANKLLLLRGQDQDQELSSAVEAIHTKVIRMISTQPPALVSYTNTGGSAGGSAAVIAYIESLFAQDIKSSRLYAALITEHLKLDNVSDALAAVEKLLQEPNDKLLEANRFIDIAYMAVLNNIIKSNSIAYYEKGRIIDRYIKKLVNKRIKTLPTFSLYTDYLIKDRNDIYVYIDMLNEMSFFFGQDACNIWEVKRSI